MIVAKFEDLKRYESLNPLFPKAFEWILKTDLKKLEAGKIEIEGSDLFASISEYETKNLDEAFFETHRKYIDIQFMIEGGEKIGWAPATCLEELEPYAEENDFHKLKGTAKETVELVPEVACILFPEDGHEPCLNLCDGKKNHSKKVCMKVRV